MSNKHIDFIKEPLSQIYGENRFDDDLLRERLPKSIYKELKAVQLGEKDLSLQVAEVVAGAMKDWAMEKGATHFTHWFQPLTGRTAEKHDSFISTNVEGDMMLEFSGKELVKGEPDASSFPNGGIRATFEARGYTAWDTNSPAFLKEGASGVTLYIPTAFVSYTGEALDRKVPLLRSMEAINKQTLRVLRAMGNTSTKRVQPTVGPEQEYFLVDRKLYNQRPDLIFSGRTLLGAMPPKGQELEDHYFGAIPERVAHFMRELNYELWRLGVAAKTQHKEVAPNQYELATIFSTANVAQDSNQIVMETICTVAERHGLVALLHEKPFAGVNGSGKHNNWSLATDDGLNLLEPGESPETNASFLLFLSAVIKAVDLWAPMLRVSVANSGNDHRLGANEAPPAIVSIFLGDQLTDLLNAIGEGRVVKGQDNAPLKIGHTKLPKLPKDLSDRNRTSPFAFTGNKFEFRMVPSSESIGEPNTVLNTAIADVLKDFADTLEKAQDPFTAINDIVSSVWKKHSRIVFNGNGYAEDWVKEAEKRGLPNFRSTVDALPEYAQKAAIDLFERHHVYTKIEAEARMHIALERYCKEINIEAGTMVDMIDRGILPCAFKYQVQLAETIRSVKLVLPSTAMTETEAELKKLVELTETLKKESLKLEDERAKVKASCDDSLLSHAQAYKTRVVPAMNDLRKTSDSLERMVPKDMWPFPTYADLLFSL